MKYELFIYGMGQLHICTSSQKKKKKKKKGG